MMAFVVVTFSVLLNVGTAVILKTTADQGAASTLIVLTGIGLSFFLNGLRFLAWGYANKRYRLSYTYPITSLFFPLMLLVTYAYHEPVHITQWIGTILISIGVIALTRKVESKDAPA